jgi:hypothetical protein
MKKWFYKREGLSWGGIFSSIILSPTMKKWSYKRDGLS